MRTLVLLLGVLLMSVPARAAEAPATDRLLTDFSAATSDLGWRVVNDNVMGGRSRGGFTKEGSVLHFRGATNTNGGGFSSIRTGRLQLDLAGYEGIRVRVRGDGRRYTWRLTTDARWRGRTVSWWADFDTRKGVWTESRIPWSAFKPKWRGFQVPDLRFDPRAIRSMGLMIYDKKDGAFDLRMDKVHAYRKAPASPLAAYKGAKRVLVLGAPSADDARLRNQLADLEATRAAFAERDMLLVLALEDGTSRAGRQTLSAEQSAAVRKQLGLSKGGFGLRLIGKDGGLKRLATAPTAMAEIYALIDGMPMRKREAVERSAR